MHQAPLKTIWYKIYLRPCSPWQPATLVLWLWTNHHKNPLQMETEFISSRSPHFTEKGRPVGSLPGHIFVEYPGQQRAKNNLGFWLGDQVGRRQVGGIHRFPCQTRPKRCGEKLTQKEIGHTEKYIGGWRKRSTRPKEKIISCRWKRPIQGKAHQLLDPKNTVGRSSRTALVREGIQNLRS